MTGNNLTTLGLAALLGLAPIAPVDVAAASGDTAPAAPATPADRPPGREPVVGGPCEGCDAVFQGLPAALSAAARIAPAEEPGDPLRIRGTVTHADGSPAPGTIVYGYQTNAAGIYPADDAARGTAAHRHGRLRAWARADTDGRYRFDTIRPGSYPGTDIPQHIHLHVIEPGRCTYYIDDVLFADDPHLTPEAIRQLTRGRGGDGVAVPQRAEDGVWLAVRDIRLGQNIPDYPPSGTQDPETR